MEVGSRIRYERQRLGLSQEELACRAYVSRPTLSHWETGRTLPDAQSLLALSEIFETSIDELVRGDINEMEKLVKREAHVALGRTIALACTTAGAASCLIVTSFAARPMVGSVALFAMSMLSAVIGLTVVLRGGDRSMSAVSAAGVLSALNASGSDSRAEGAVRDRLFDEIARDGVKDPYGRLVLSVACAVDIACALVWVATLVEPDVFV